MNRASWAKAWGLVAVALFLSAVFLFLYNPRIGGTSYGEPYRCLAPWDTVLNGAANTPGGDPPPDSLSIEERCRAAGATAFAGSAAAATGGLAAAIAGVTVGVQARRDRRAGAAADNSVDAAR